MAWRQKIIDKNIQSNVNLLISDLLASVESAIIQSGSGSTITNSNNNNDNIQPDDVIFKWEEISKSVEFKSARFKRRVNKTTYKIDHNFGSFSDLFQIESNIDNLYETFMNE